MQDRFKREFDLSKPSIYWDKSLGIPRIGFELADDVIEFMSEDSAIRKSVADALKAVYRYDGQFSISFDIPY